MKILAFSQRITLLFIYGQALRGKAFAQTFRVLYEQS